MRGKLKYCHFKENLGKEPRAQMASVDSVLCHDSENGPHMAGAEQLAGPGNSSVTPVRGE